MRNERRSRGRKQTILLTILIPTHYSILSRCIWLGDAGTDLLSAIAAVLIV